MKHLSWTGAVRAWLPFAGIATILCLLVEVAVQQNFRTNADDPQIQLVEDAASRLSSGARPQTVLPLAPGVDVATSLAPWIAVYDDSGRVRASNGRLDGALPVFPHGVFTAARRDGEDRVTWQPRLGVRSALVVAHYAGGKVGFVAAGRSLREIEGREAALAHATFAAWFASLAVAFAMQLFYAPRPLTKKSSTAMRT